MIRDKIIKVCGMRDEENILAVDSLGVDFMGFIFYSKSPRYVASLPATMPTTASRVGVFVNEELGEIESRIESFGLEYVQLHGSEAPLFCESVAALGVKVIKAFSVDSIFDFDAVEPYAKWCDLFVFDTKCSGYGGSGEQFDWSLLDNYRGVTPFLLSGGISMESVDSLARLCHPQLVGYDLNSRFELSPALKDIECLTQFLEQLK